MTNLLDLICNKITKTCSDRTKDSPFSKNINVNYSDVTQSCLPQNAIYGNTFQAGRQTSVNKHNENSFILALSLFQLKKSDHDVKLNYHDIYLLSNKYNHSEEC